MSVPHQSSKAFLAVTLLFLARPAATSAEVQKVEQATSQLPPELQGAKIYHFPDEKKSGQPPENPVIYKSVSYQDINLDRLLLDLFLSVKPVERSATIRKIYFQNIRVSGVPVHLETFDQEFKLSKKDIVDLPAPLKCSILFSDLESLSTVKEIVNKDKIQITGQSFIEVKLNAIEKLALRTKQLVLPVTLNEEVPLQMFSGNPFLQMAVGKVLETLSDPSSSAAIALAKEHFAKLARDHTMASLAGASLYLLQCEYILRGPKSQTGEKFSQSGTGFIVSADGKLLTAKRVIEPWKFDPQIAFVMGRYNLEVDPKSYRISAWPAGAQVLSPDGQLDFKTAFTTDKQTLKILKIAPDRIEKQEYQDPDSGRAATVNLHAPGEGDTAVLQLVGGNAQPLPFADPSIQVAPELKTFLAGYPFGLSQAKPEPQNIPVKAAKEGPLIKMEHLLNPGESGAPLLTQEGRVLAFAGGKDECIPIQMTRTMIQ